MHTVNTVKHPAKKSKRTEGVPQALDSPPSALLDIVGGCERFDGDVCDGPIEAAWDMASVMGVADELLKGVEVGFGLRVAVDDEGRGSPSFDACIGLFYEPELTSRST